MCSSPPTVVVKSTLLPELLMLLGPVLALVVVPVVVPLAVALLVVEPLVLGTTLQHVSKSELVSTLEPVVGGNLGNKLQDAC
jgi:hypothetical protein